MSRHWVLTLGGKVEGRRFARREVTLAPLER